MERALINIDESGCSKPTTVPSGRVYPVIESARPTTGGISGGDLAHLRGILAANDAVVCTIDQAFCVTMVNHDGPLALANHAPVLAAGHLLGRSVLYQLPEAARRDLGAVCRAVFDGSLACHQRRVVVSREDRLCVYQLTITPLCSDRGIVGAVLNCSDVSRVAALQETVKRQRQQLRKLYVASRRSEARTGMLRRTAEALNSTRSLSSTLRVIAEAAVNESDVHAAVVYLLIDDEQLVPAGQRGLRPGDKASRAFWLESTLARKVVQGGQPVIVEDRATWPELALPELRAGAARSAAALPIAGPAGVTGVLEVYSTHAQAFDADHIAVLHALADQAASAIRTAQSVDRDRRQVRLLRLLNRVGEQLASELNTQAIVRLVTEALVEQLGLAFARVWLFDQSSQTLVLRASSGLYTATGGPFERIKLGQHTVGHIAATRQAAIVNDVQKEPGLGDTRWAEASGMVAFAGFPLVARNRLLGVLGFFSRSALDVELVKMLEPLAHQVALALERSQLYVAEVAARREAQELARLAGLRAAQLGATLAAMTDGVWTCDADGRMLAINDAALAMFDLADAAPHIETISDLPALFADDCADRDVALGLPAALQGRSVRRELTLRPRDRALPVHVALIATPLRDSQHGTAGAVAVVRDISYQKAMEQLKDEFLAIAAHELKTPVTAIKGYTQLALSRLMTGADPERLKRALLTIDQQAQRIAHLVQELLDVSQIKAGNLTLHLEPCDMTTLARSSVERVQSTAKGHRFELDLPAAMPGVWDCARIEQVLDNMLENAVKYSPVGSAIALSVRASDDMVQVTVRDSGIGIASDKQARIFEPWYQAHAEDGGDYGGMGLGLSICKEIVQRHGGRIWLESKEDQGSLFGIALPRRSSAE